MFSCQTTPAKSYIALIGGFVAAGHIASPTCPADLILLKSSAQLTSLYNRFGIHFFSLFTLIFRLSIAYVRVFVFFGF